MNCARFAMLFLLVAVPAQAARLESRIRRILAQDPAARGAFAGIFAVDDHGRKLVSLNADRLFVPASNTKLFSIALALERLGPDKRFETRVELRPDSEGGFNLVLVGNGDANLSGRILPYQYNSTPGPPLAAIEDLATQAVAQLTLQRIQSIHDVIGDDTAFLYEPFAPTWEVEDLPDSDGAPVSALVINDNSFKLQISPASQENAPAALTFDPPLPVLEVTGGVTTAIGPDRIEVERFPGDPMLHVWGTIDPASPPRAEHLAVEDPARFAALALLRSIEQHGVAVTGQTRAAHRYKGMPYSPATPGPVIAKRTSEPLVRDLEVTGKTSQNLHSDLLLFDVAGSREQGLQELGRFLSEAGLKPDQYRFYDGSGLSRKNLVSPEAVVGLLTFMSRSPRAEQFLGALPISGIDGSLAGRLDKPASKGRIHAKTGTLDHVSALSGYVDARHNRRLIFSIFINNTLAGSGERQDLIDKICLELVK